MFKILTRTILMLALAACSHDDSPKTPPGHTNRQETSSPAKTPDPAPSPQPAPEPEPNPQESVQEPLKFPMTLPAPSPTPFFMDLPHVGPIAPNETSPPDAPRIGESVNFADGDFVVDRNGIKFAPIIKSAEYTIYTWSWSDWHRDTAKIPVVKILKGDTIDREAARLEVAYMSRESSSGYNKHIVRRGVELRDGNLLIVVTDGSQFAPSFRYSYVMKTDANLKGMPSFGKNGVISFGDTRSRMNYRFIRKITETPNGDLFLYERREMSEGEYFGTMPPKCYRHKFNAKGKKIMKFGRRGVEALPSCEGL